MNMRSITEYIDSFKQSCDNDTVVYIFQNDYGFAINRELLEAELPAVYNESEVFNFYRDILRPAIGSGQVKNLLYKNNFGKWIKLFPLINDYKHVTQLFQLANDEAVYPNYIASKTILPEMIYTDKDRKMHKIYARDNTKTFIRRKPVYIDELNTNQVQIEQYSIENPSYGFSLRHLMYDLKVTLKEGLTNEDILVNLNGVFVEPIKAKEDNVFYIKNARFIYRTMDTIIGENTNFIPSVHSKLSDASLDLDPNSSYLKNYSINLRIFKWNDVRIDKWLNVQHIDYYMKAYEFKNVRIIKSLTFDRPIKKNSCLVICNGQIMDPSEYRIEDNKVFLLSLEQEFALIYRELKKKGITFALTEASNYINSRYYYVVNLEDKLSDSEIILRRTTPLDTNLMGYGTVLFDDIDPQDLLTVDGTFLPYHLNDNGLIQFPKFYKDTLYEEESILPFKDRKFIKYEVVTYYESIE